MYQSRPQLHGSLGTRLPYYSTAHALNHVMADLHELLGFLTLGSPRLDLKSAALDCVLGLTGSKDGQKLIRDNQGLLRCLFDLTKDAQPQISRDACLALVNLSGVEGIADVILGLGVIPGLLKCLVDPKYTHADKVCMILSNLTRSERGSMEFVKVITGAGGEPVGGECPTLYQLVDIFDQPGYNKDANLHYLAPLFSNISQVPVSRHLLMDRSKCVVQRFLPYTQFGGSLIRRGGVVGLLRNLCFEVGKQSSPRCGNKALKFITAAASYPVLGSL